MKREYWKLKRDDKELDLFLDYYSKKYNFVASEHFKYGFYPSIISTYGKAHESEFIIVDILIGIQRNPSFVIGKIGNEYVSISWFDEDSYDSNKKEIKYFNSRQYKLIQINERR